MDAGIDVFSLANNHSFDYGPPGARATLSSLQELSSASGRAADARWPTAACARTADQPFAPAEIRVKGWRIGYLAVTQFSNEWVTEPLLAVVDYNDQAQAARFLRDAVGNHAALRPFRRFLPWRQRVRDRARAGEKEVLSRDARRRSPHRARAPSPHPAALRGRRSRGRAAPDPVLDRATFSRARACAPGRGTPTDCGPAQATRRSSRSWCGRATPGLR